MSDQDEIKALMEELEQLQAEAAEPQRVGPLSANNARQTEIRTRLTELGHPIG
jgi:hypothetical protein